MSHDIITGVSRRTLLSLGAGVACTSMAGIVGAGAQDGKNWRLRLQSFSARGPDIQWVSPEKFLEFVRDETKGRVDIRPFPAGQLVPTREIITAIVKSVVDAGTFTGSYAFGQFPSTDWGSLPIVNDRAEWYKVMDNGLRQYIEELFRKEGLAILTIYPIDDITVFAGRTQFIQSLEDFKGKRLRGVGGVMDEFMAKQGAGVTVMSLGDAYTALQTGVVEAVTTALAGYYTMKGWEVAPKMTWAKGMGITVQQIVAINLSTWDAFPNDVKEAIRRAETRHREWDANFIGDWRTKAVEEFKSKGASILILDPAESAKWRAAYLNVALPFFLSVGGEQGRRTLEIVEKALGRKILT